MPTTSVTLPQLQSLWVQFIRTHEVPCAHPLLPNYLVPPTPMSASTSIQKGKAVLGKHVSAIISVPTASRTSTLSSCAKSQRRQSNSDLTPITFSATCDK